MSQKQLSLSSLTGLHPFSLPDHHDCDDDDDNEQADYDGDDDNDDDDDDDDSNKLEVVQLQFVKLSGLVRPSLRISGKSRFYHQIVVSNSKQ